jgi:uncharacterized protein involved in exopolysaccharide biosynthesis
MTNTTGFSDDSRSRISENGGTDDDISVVALATALFRRIPLILRVAGAVVVIALIMTAVKGVRYVAESKFTLQTNDDRNSRIGGLASQLGVVLPGSGGPESLQFYVELLKSREIQRQAVTTQYTVKTGKDGEETVTGDFATLLKVQHKTPEQRTRRAMMILGNSVLVTPSLEANLVSMRVNTPYPDLSVQVNRRLLDLLDERSRELKQQRAGSEREFARARMDEMRNELRSAETQLQEFLTNNKYYQTSPRQVLDFNRIQRRVDLYQQLYVSLSQAYEQARLDEVRTTPLITVVDPPERSARGSGGRYARNAMIGLILGSVLGIILAILSEYFDRFRISEPQRYAELTSLTRATRAKLSPRRLFAQVNGGSK